MHSKRLETTIFTFLITAVSLAVMALLAYRVTTNALRQEITNAYHVSLIHTEDRMENYLQQLDRATLQLEKNPELERLLGVETRKDPMDALSMQIILQRIHASAEHVDNVVIYDLRKQTLLATNPYMNRLYDDYLPVVSGFLSMNTKRAFIDMEVEGIPTTVYVRKMPAFTQVQPLLIIFHINQYLYDVFLGEERYSESGAYFILQKDGDLLALRGRYGEENFQPIMERINRDKDSVPETGVGAFTLDGTFVTYLPPSFDGWVYGFTIPSEVFLHSLNTIRNILLLVAVGLFITSILLSFLSSHWVWKGWAKIKNILADSQEEEKNRDEFDMVVSRIRKVVDHSLRIEDRMKELMPSLTEAFLTRILDTGIKTGEDRLKAEELGIELPDGAFACLCVELDLDWDRDRYSEGDVACLEYATGAVLRETITKWGKGQVIKDKDACQVALVYASAQQASTFDAQVSNLTQTLRTFIERYFPLTVSIGISRIRNNYGQIDVSYREAKEVLRNKYVAGGNQVFTHRDMDALEAVGQDPIQGIENEIFQGIRTLNRQYAYAAASQLVELKGTQTLPYTWLQSRLVECAQAIYRRTEKLADGRDTGWAPILEELLTLRTMEDWVTWFKEKCIDPLVDYLENRQRIHGEVIVKKIRNFVRFHLEEDLRLEDCCAALDLPVLSARTALKQTEGMTFIDLLLSERMEQAKEWLSTDSMSVETIARRLRYSNAQNFTRTFKKAVGMPPGQFRAATDRAI